MRNAQAAEDERIEVRVAINTGEVEVRGNDVFGETVNIAARIEGITEPGEVYFTHATYLSMNKAEVPTSEVGERRLKGIDEPIRVYRVIRDETLDAYRSLIQTQRESSAANPVASAAPVTDVPQRKRWMPLLVAVVVLCVVAAGVGPSIYDHYAARQEVDRLRGAIAKVTTRDEETALFDALKRHRRRTS